MFCAFFCLSFFFKIFTAFLCCLVKYGTLQANISSWRVAMCLFLLWMKSRLLHICIGALSDGVYSAGLELTFLLQFSNTEINFFPLFTPVAEFYGKFCQNRTLQLLSTLARRLKSLSWGEFCPSVQVSLHPPPGNGGRPSPGETVISAENIFCFFLFLRHSLTAG